MEWSLKICFLLKERALKLSVINYINTFNYHRSTETAEM